MFIKLRLKDLSRILYDGVTAAVLKPHDLFLSLPPKDTSSSLKALVTSPAYLPALVIIISVPNSKNRCHKSLICSSIVMSSHSNVSADPTRLCMACIEPRASVARSKDRQAVETAKLAEELKFTCEFDHPIVYATYLVQSCLVIHDLSKLPSLKIKPLGLYSREISATQRRRRSLERIDSHLRVIWFDA